MTIDPEMLMAYADGELDPLSARRVEQAIAADPSLAEQVDRHRTLAASLRATYSAVEQAPLPAAIEAKLRESARVVPLAPRPRRERALWLGAMAASLVLGLVVGPLVLPRGGGDIAVVDGAILARGAVAKALDTQLASAQPSDAAVRIGVTFRDGAGRLCRTFEQGATGGIACTRDAGWQVERLYGGVARQGGEYRQAGSPAASLMEDAQAMMAGEPLDAAAEAQAVRALRR